LPKTVMMNSDLTISFFDCCRVEAADVFSLAGEQVFSGGVFHFAPSYSFGPSFSLPGSLCAVAWQVAEKCWSEVAAVCLTVGARTSEVKRQVAAVCRGVMNRVTCAGRRLLARISILRV